jgi:chromosome segregation ATPase
MPAEKHYSDMNSEDLLKELDRLAGDLEDLEQEREYLLRRTGVHVSRDARKGAEAAIDGIREQLREIRDVLQGRGFGARVLEKGTAPTNVPGNRS